VTSPDYRVFSLRENAQINDKYLLRLLQNAYLQRIFYAYGQGSSQLGRWRLPTDGFLDFVIPAPPPEEQTAIARFLDRETAKIDALIAEQQRLIELLQEKRQAVISHAVTKGLNPNAPMKDSGVEWLGEVPEHWEMRRLKDLCVVTGGGTPSRENPEYWHEEIPWVSPKDMKSELIDSAEEWISELGLQQSTTSLIPKGSLLIVVRSGILKRTIPAGISQVPVAINQDIKALSFNRSQVSPEYVLRFIQGLSVALLPCWSKQGATVESIEQSYMGNTLICCPSLQEQQAISIALRDELSKLDNLSCEARKLTIALEERRSALISAAVTGQIDVRGLVPEASEQ
jgi:type I restriction enzyme S subunit